MSKRKNTRRVRADTKQAPITTMDAFSNPIARLGFGTGSFTGHAVSAYPYDTKLPAAHKPVS